MGTIIFAIGMTIAGMTFAFVKGWSLSLAIMAIFPFMMTITSFLGKVMQGGFKENMKAYGQSAGYAEQALNAIRVVAAYGQEEKELKNYERYLDRARKAGVKTHCRGSLAVALFFSVMFSSYAYSFYIGSVWIEHDIINSTYNRPYRAGEVLSCFFGVVFGIFMIG